MRRRLLAISLSVLLLLAGGLFALLTLQKDNFQQVAAAGLDNRLLPHAVNTPQRLSATLASELRSMEIDLFFVSTAGGGYFEVRHDKAGVPVVTLEQYLGYLQGYQIKKIWFDVKNIDDRNSAAVLHELQRLDTRFGISKYVIIESPFQSDTLRQFRTAGFHTSYYLPIGQIRRLIEAGDTQGLRAKAAEIAELLRRQQSAAVSFHLDLYPFVKHYLEPLIDARVVYHGWASIRLYYPNALKRLQQADYYDDPRVETILYDPLQLPMS